MRDFRRAAILVVLGLNVCLPSYAAKTECESAGLSGPEEQRWSAHEQATSIGYDQFSLQLDLFGVPFSEEHRIPISGYIAPDDIVTAAPTDESMMAIAKDFVATGNRSSLAHGELVEYQAPVHDGIVESALPTWFKGHIPAEKAEDFSTAIFGVLNSWGVIKEDIVNETQRRLYLVISKGEPKTALGAIMVLQTRKDSDQTLVFHVGPDR